MPQTGDTAPMFTAPALTRGGERAISLSDFAGKQSVVLYFYPKDDTPGCTREACSFRDLSADFEGRRGHSGVSPDSIASHTRFAANTSFPSPSSPTRIAPSAWLTASGRRR